MLFLKALLNQENSRSFDGESILNFSRKDAYECKVPRTRMPNQHDIRHSNQVPSACNPLTQESIPPEDLLKHWSDIIRARQSIAAGYFYMQSSLGAYDDNAIQIALRLHKASSIKKQVEREVDWFSRPCLAPNSAEEHPNNESLHAFQSLIWSSRGYGNDIPGMGTSPSVLAWLCGNQELSCDHLLWFQKKLNSIQEHTVVLYLNYGRQNLERAITRITSTRTIPQRKLALMMNVGKDSNGDVFLGSDARQGNHYTLAHLDATTNTLFYCDSLGWKVPRELMGEVRRVYRLVFKGEMAGVTIICCHDYTLANGGVHFCDKSKCSTFYPLQTCGYICGVITIVATVAACLSQSFFAFLTKTHRLDTRHVPLLYLQKPTQYARYLRRVLMVWMADDLINIKLIVPSMFLEGEEGNNDAAFTLPSDSESEEEVLFSVYSYIPVPFSYVIVDYSLVVFKA